MKIKANIINHNQSFLGEIQIKDGKIFNVTKINNEIDNTYDFLLPSFVDSHTHGGYGFDFNFIHEWTNDELNFFSKQLYNEGVTNIAFTTVTTNLEHLQKISNWFALNSIDFLIGWHLEGPFLSKIKKGAHNENEIIEVNSNWVETLANNLKHKKIILTSALEHSRNAEILTGLASNNFFVSLGHSNASYYDVKNFFELNLFDRYTHLFNAMSGFDHKNPGIVFAAFDIKKGYVELIGDGVHIDNNVLRYSYENIGTDRIILISDSLSLKGQKDGDFLLGNVPVEKKGNVCFIKNTTTLAGSCFKYIDIVKNFVESTKCHWEDIVKVTSYNYFRSINLLNHYGEIKESKNADLVLLDKNLKILEVFKAGKRVYNI